MMPEAGELSPDGDDRSSRARSERRVRLCIVATGTVAAAAFVVYATTGDEAPPHEISAAHFLGFWVFLHAALTLLVLCVVAVLVRVTASDATDSEPPNAATVRSGARSSTGV